MTVKMHLSVSLAEVGAASRALRLGDFRVATIALISTALILFAPNFSAVAQPAASFESAVASAAAIGEARDPSNGELLYIETYADDPLAPRATVRYWAADGSPLAVKILDFTTDEQAPNLRLIDYRNQRGYTLARGSANLEIRRQRYRNDFSKASNDKLLGRVTTSENLVADAGFNRFILANWQRLSNSGGSARFEFLQLDKARTVGLKLKRKACAQEQGATAAERLCLTLNIDNLLLRRLVKPIRLVYDMNTRRLLRFTGLGQLAGADGKALVVDLQYRYPQ